VNSLEQLIRNALAKQDVPDAQMRQQVYASARKALERTLSARGEITLEQVAESRHRLEGIIKLVESEHLAPPVQPAPVAPQPAPQAVPHSLQPPQAAPQNPQTQPNQAPQIQPQAQSQVQPQTSAAAAKSTGAASAADEPKTNIYSLLLSAAVAIAFVVLAGWWLMNNDMFSTKPSEQEVANPKGTTDRGAPNGGRDWITVLAPTDIDKLVAASSNRAKLVTELGQPELELTFGLDRDTRGDFQLQVGRGVLAAYAGQTVQFDLAMSGSDLPVPIAVECDFGSLGDCKRIRYSVPTQPASLVFSVDLPEGEPNGSGVIKISGQGDSVMGATISLHHLRVSPKE